MVDSILGHQRTNQGSAVVNTRPLFEFVNHLSTLYGQKVIRGVNAS